MVGADAETEEALRELDRLGDGEAAADRQPSRLSPAGSASAGWVGPANAGARYLFTVEAVRRLVARRDQVVRPRRWAPAASLAVDLADAAQQRHLRPRRRPRRARPRHAVARRERWQRRLDALVSVVLAIPALIFALPLELVGAALGRGSVLSLRVELL